MPTGYVDKYGAESERIARRLRLAREMQQRAMEPIDLPQTPGVQVSPLSGLAKILQGVIGNVQEGRANKEQEKLTSGRAERSQQELAQLAQMMSGIPQAPIAGPSMPAGPAGDFTRQQGMGAPLGMADQVAMPNRSAGAQDFAGLMAGSQIPENRAMLQQLMVHSAERDRQQGDVIAGEQRGERRRIDQEQRGETAQIAEEKRKQEMAQALLKDKRFNVRPGGELVDAQGNSMFKAPAVPSVDKAPAGYKLNPDGSMSAITGGPGDPKVIAGNRAPKEAKDPTPVGTWSPIIDPKTGGVTKFYNSRTLEVKDAPEGVKGLRKNPLAAGTVKNVADLENSARKVDELGEAFKPEFVGPVEGRKRMLMAKLPGSEVPKDYAKFFALTANIKNDVIKLITGAQMGQQEAERIKQQIPLETDKPEIWLAKYKVLSESVQDIRGRIKEGSGLGGNAETPTAAPAAGLPKGWKVEVE